MSDIIELVGQVVTLKKASTIDVDSGGTRTSTTYTDVTATVVMQPLNTKDLDRHSDGRASTGLKKVYCKPSYSQGGTDYVVDVGDYFVDWDGVEWRVEKIETDQNFGETEVYRKVIVNKVV